MFKANPLQQYSRKDPHPHVPFEERDKPDSLREIVLLIAVLALAAYCGYIVLGMPPATL